MESRLSTLTFLLVLGLAIVKAVPVPDGNRDARGWWDSASQFVGGGLGTLGNMFFPQEETRYKCAGVMGYPYSGPESVHPERYDNMKTEEESDSFLDKLSKASGAAFGHTFNTLLPAAANRQLCLTVGLGYDKPQPGYPQTPGGGGPINGGEQSNGGQASPPSPPAEPEPAPAEPAPAEPAPAEPAPAEPPAQPTA